MYTEVMKQWAALGGEKKKKTLEEIPGGSTSLCLS